MVRVEILPTNPDISFAEAAEIARKVRGRIEALEGIDNADVHLEVDEHSKGL